MQGSSGRSKPRLPITPDLLRKLRSIWLANNGGRNELMLWAAATSCFFGFFRAGKITVPSDSSFDGTVHLSFADVAVDDLAKPSMLKVHLKVSKTDPFGKGVDVVIGKTADDLYPVRAMLDYLLAKGAGPGPLFHFHDGKPLTRTRFVDRTREALSRAGVDSELYSGHSFRSGAATAAARVGVQDSTIKMLGRWKSKAFQLYIKTPRHQLASASVSRRLTESSHSMSSSGTKSSQ